MILFGHLGFGLKLSRPFLNKTPSIPLRWLLIGTLLPDLVDKPIYYGLSIIRGAQGADLGLISGTRTFGHTVLFLVLLILVSAATRSRIWTALALGAATHLLVDHLGDSMGYAIWPAHELVQLDANGRNLSLVGLLWPFLGNYFPVSPHPGIIDHMRTFGRPHIWIGEILGLLFLITDQRIWERLWKRAYSPFKSRSSS